MDEQMEQQQPLSPVEAEESPALQDEERLQDAEVSVERPAEAESDLVIAEAVAEPPSEAASEERTVVKAVIEAAIYITDEPLTPEQIATAVQHPLEQVKAILADLVAEYASPDRGLSIREVAGGYKMSTKAEHHESIRRFVKNLQPPLKLSLAALETLAVVAYKQPITAPEIMDIRGVQGTGVLKTLLDRKLIATAGRKNVLGKPIMYRTTRDFLVQFGLSSLAELPTLKEFEELGRLAFSDSEELAPAGAMGSTGNSVANSEADADGGAATSDAKALETETPETESSGSKQLPEGDHPTEEGSEANQEQEAQEVNG